MSIALWHVEIVNALFAFPKFLDSEIILSKLDVVLVIASLSSIRISNWVLKFDSEVLNFVTYAIAAS